jgi:5S rRNA maturation endonuclease (ribonuclease M5)
VSVYCADLDLLRIDPVELVLTRLEALGCDPRQSGDGWKFKCPAHDDHNPSGWLGLGHDGLPDLRCFAGCETSAIVAALELPPPALLSRSGAIDCNGRRSIVATYDYTDERDELLFQVVRYEPKGFAQRRPDGAGGWTWKLGDARRVLYRLPGVIAAVEHGETVHLVEGERDVQALEAIGLVASCNPAGAGKWRPEYAQSLRGGRVVVIADRDDVGRRHAQRVHSDLQGIAASVDLREPARGKDVAELIELGGSIPDDLRELAAGGGTEVGQRSGDRYSGRIIDVPALLAEPDVPIPWRCEGFAADGLLTVLAGRGGEGKSWFGLALSRGVALGQNAAGIPCTKGRAIIFDAENGRKLIARRFRAAAMIADIHVQPVEADGLLIQRDLDWFKSVIVEQKAHFAVFDSLRVLSSGTKESDSDEMEPIITAMKGLARETGVAILLIHHRGKSELSEFRGSSVIRDQTDMLYTLGRVQGDPESRTRRKITTIKCRIEEEREPRWVQIESDRGLLSINEAEPYDGDGPSRPRDSLRRDVLNHLGGIARSGRSIARTLDRNEATVRRVLHDLEADELIERRDDGWVRHRDAPVGGDAPDAPTENGSVEPNKGASAIPEHNPFLVPEDGS